MKDSILICTQRNSSHADELVLELTRMKQKVFRLNVEDLPRLVISSLKLEDNYWEGVLENKQNGLYLDLQKIKSVWWRVKRRFERHLIDFEGTERNFVAKELHHFLYGLTESLDCYCIDRPSKISRAMWKLEQLTRAKDLGFSVPYTIITSNSEFVKEFYSENERTIIYKTLSDSSISSFDRTGVDVDEKVEIRQTMTTMITEEHLQIIDSVKNAPCIFQAYVPKDVELRVTVIGDEVFVAEIHSQQSELTKVDWRNYSANITYKEGSLPVEIQQLCWNFIQSYNMSFGTIDLIRKPEGEHVFLENNPVGQFLFIEHRIPKLKMKSALANCLINAK